MEFKEFKLINGLGQLIDTKDYIPQQWYVLANHYGHSIEVYEPATKLKEECDCEDYENGLVSNFCEVHNGNPYKREDQLP